MACLLHNDLLFYYGCYFVGYCRFSIRYRCYPDSIRRSTRHNCGFFQLDYFKIPGERAFEIIGDYIEDKSKALLDRFRGIIRPQEPTPPQEPVPPQDPVVSQEPIPP